MMKIPKKMRTSMLNKAMMTVRVGVTMMSSAESPSKVSQSQKAAVERREKARANDMFSIVMNV